VTADGRFQVGPSQDHRPDLPQGNVLVSALDPLGMPVAPAGVSGQRADAPRDVPAMTRGRESLGRREGLDVGAGPMGALETRAALQAGGDCSLGPLSEIQLPPAIRARDLAPTWRGDHPVPPLHRSPQGGRPALIAEGCEPLKRLLAVVAGAQVCWTERRLGSRSTQLAQAGERRRPSPPAVSSHPPLLHALAHSGHPHLPCRPLYEGLCRCSQPALKMSEP
jgi:hypothetical protein